MRRARATRPTRAHDDEETGKATLSLFWLVFAAVRGPRIEPPKPKSVLPSCMAFATSARGAAAARWRRCAAPPSTSSSSSSSSLLPPPASGPGAGRPRCTAAGAAAPRIDVSVKLVGVSFGDRQAAIERTPVGAAVACVRQPENPHDADAVECFDLRGLSLGFLPRALNTVLVSAHAEGVFARVLSVGRNDKGLFGLTIAMKREGPGLIVTPSPVRGGDPLRRMEPAQARRLRAAVLGEEEAGGAAAVRCPYCQRHPAADISLQWSYCDDGARARVRRVLPVCPLCSSALRISRRRRGPAAGPEPSLADDMRHLEKVNGLTRAEACAYLASVRATHARRLATRDWAVDTSLLGEMLGEEPKVAPPAGDAGAADPLLPDPLVL